MFEKKNAKQIKNRKQHPDSTYFPIDLRWIFFADFDYFLFLSLQNDRIKTGYEDESFSGDLM